MKTKINLGAIITVAYFTTGIFIATSCSKGSINEQSNKTPTTLIDYNINTIDYYAGGMHYKVFYTLSGDVFVVNITKDRSDFINNKQSK